MLSCRDTTALLSRSMDERLSLAERLAVRIHLKVCDACTRYRAHLLFLRELIREGFTAFPEAEEFTGIGLPTEARARLLRALATEGTPPAD